MQRRRLANKVPQITTLEVRKMTHEVIDIIFSKAKRTSQKMDIVQILERLHNKEEIVLRILEDELLTNEYAVTLPQTREMLVRESVYHAAYHGNERHRFTLAHELGHLVLHANVSPAYAFSEKPSDHHYTEDCEWQANEFAGEFLVDSRQLSGVNSPEEISKIFGVSLEVAEIVYRKYRKEGIL